MKGSDLLHQTDRLYSILLIRITDCYEYNIIGMHKIDFFKKLLMTYFFMSGKDPFSPVIPDLNLN